MKQSSERPVAHSKIPWRVRLSELETERAAFDAHWREIDLFMAPGRFRDGHNAEENRGEKKHRKIIDETALRARRVFVAGFVSGMTSPARPWFKLTVPDSDLAEFSSVRAWLEEVERRINLILARSNFYHAIANVYDDLGTFGTAALSVTERRDSVVWFRPHPVGDFHVSANDDMLVDTIYRQTKLTVRQLVERFGRENCANSTLASYDAGNLEERVDVVQAIEPNDKRLAGLPDARNKPFRSVWFEESGEENKYLGQYGFDEFPSMVVRWQASPLDDYGIDCPGMTALGGVKQLQHQQLKKGQAIDKMVNPHLQVPPNLKGVRSFLPGGTTVYDQTSPNGGIRPIHDVSLRLDYMLNDIREVQQRIHESFFVDLFLMISQQDDVRTATEIALRNEEKLLVLGPALQRVQTELLDPLLDRVFAIMERAGAIPLPPPELEGMPLQVKYISMLAQAQQSVVASSVERFLGAAGSMAQMNPGVLEKVDFDETLEEYAEILGVPQRLLKSNEDVAAARDAQAQQVAAAEQLDALQQGADVAKTVSEVDASPDGALAQLLGGGDPP